MSPAIFPQANTRFGPPDGFDESQIFTIPGHLREITGGSLDGSLAVIVAWLPDREDLERLSAGQPVYITMIGGLAPHKLSTSFEVAASD